MGQITRILLAGWIGSIGLFPPILQNALSQEPPGFNELEKAARESCEKESSVKDCNSTHCSFKKSGLCKGKPIPTKTPFHSASAPALPVDSKITFWSFNDPKEMVKSLYCYYVFQGTIKTESIPPAFFAFSIKGAGFSSVESTRYAQWLKSQEGKHCSAIVKKALHTAVSYSHFQDLFHGKEYVVFLNPNALIAYGGGSKYQTEQDTTFNHERLHIAYAVMPKAAERVKALYIKLSAADQVAFRESHAGYNFSDEKTLLKEYFSYTFESKPLEGIKELER